MKKDIFIDNNIAHNFSNPQDEEYKKLTKWLLDFDKDGNNLNNYAHLVVSKKLLVEYFRSAYMAKGSTSIPIIINKLQSEGRLINISNDQIKVFQKKYFTKTIERKLRCNHEDRDHIPLVLLSNRKYALALDNNFIYDLINFSGFVTKVCKRPEDIGYTD